MSLGDEEWWVSRPASPGGLRSPSPQFSGISAEEGVPFSDRSIMVRFYH